MDEQQQVIKNVITAYEGQNGVFFVDTIKGRTSLSEFLGAIESSRGSHTYIGLVNKKIGGIENLIIVLEISILTGTPAAEYIVSSNKNKQIASGGQDHAKNTGR